MPNVNGERMSPYEYRQMGKRFSDPGGNSALHPGKRCFPCSTCGEPNRLTAADVRSHYQCDACANRAEGGGW